MRAVRLQVVLLFSILCICSAQEYVDVYLRPFPGPQVYRDPHTGTLLYVESDGRHVAAISNDGKLLWNRDPFKDGRFELYRTKTPQIVYIGPIKKLEGERREKFVGIRFNSSQFGVLRISDGEFRPLGQD